MLTDIQCFSYDSPLSVLYLSVCDQQILKLEYEPENADCFDKFLPDGDIKNWLDAYFAGQPLQHSPAMQADGTDFQKKVWNVMLTIPYGETLSYGDVSRVLDSAPRAVGQACKRNPLPVLIPCHRVIAKHSIGGYEGSTTGSRIDRKQWLLEHEKNC